ncbi:ketopantoate reductase [Saccharicrinis carchari]|uniref:2-dehydropantoate 2-reductase n=1 Tax=Saccharicrinis carchari TaxID=1168039 RepID=A0A521B7S1_SACCC|nr:2-dehydropantoate 2-reductase [Saccharicrinis carchari]SMO43147.1 ketopantoate reductase [Saccharicrinis carchari]
MNVAIIGTGGVGGYFGARLAQAGNKVSFVARGEHGRAISENGLQLLSPKGNYSLKDPNVVSSVAQLKDIELVLLGVKAWQVSEVATQLKTVISENTMVMPLQNGVMAVSELLEVLPQQNVLGGLCNIFSKIKEPGVIEHLSSEPHIIFGEPDHIVSERAKKIHYVFKHAGIENKLSDYIQGDIWKKFMLICLGGLGALTRANYGILCQSPELTEMMRQMLNEMYAVARAEGIELPESIKAKILDKTMRFAPSANSSMARDIWAGRPSELEYQNGSVVKLARRHNIEVPVNHFIYYTLLPQEQEARK